MSCKLISVYRICPSYASTNALSSLERRVIIVLLNKSKTNTFKKIKSPPCGGHVVIDDVGQHQKRTLEYLQLNSLPLGTSAGGNGQEWGVQVETLSQNE